MAGAAAGAAFQIELVDEVDTIVSAAAHASDLSTLDDDELTAVVLGFETAQAKFDAARAHALAEFDARSVTDTEWGLRTGGFIASRTHTPTRSAKRRVHVARRLRDEFPLLDQALADGKLRWEHIDMFCHHANPRVAEMLGFLLPELIELAADLPFSGWASELRRIVERLDLDGGHNPNDDITANRLFIDRTLDGTIEFHGRFVGTLGASLTEMVDRETDRQYRLHKDLADRTSGETDIPPRATLRALALVELCRKGIANTLADTNAPITDLTITHHHDTNDCHCEDHDDDSDNCDGIDNCDGTGDHAGCGDMCNNPSSRRHGRRHPRTECCAKDRCRSKACNNEFITLDGTLLTSAELGCMICDPAISLLRFAGNNAVLNLQHTQRFANRDQRRAINARDGGCIFPGCDCPVSWTDKHHVDDFHLGGPTDLRNFASLCRFHHGVTHRQDWTMVANGDGTFTWTTPKGRTLHSQSHTARNRGSPQLLGS